MFQTTKAKLLTYSNKEKLQELILLFLTFAIYFPIRKVFLSEESYITGQFSDFTTFSLYLSDILIVFYIILTIKNLYNNIKNNKVILLLTGIILLETLLNKANFSNITFYQTSRFLVYLIFLIQLKETITQNIIEKILKLTIILSVTESIIAITQFLTQSSIGLYKLGEPHLESNPYGIAKIIIDKMQIIRAYGTTPHSNILSALLTVGLFSIVTRVNFENIKKHSYLIISYITILTALILTFSRAAAIAITLTHIIWLTIALKNNKFSNETKKIVYSTIFCSIALASIIFIQTSRNHLDDSSIKERKDQTTNSISQIARSPLLGTGLGNSMLHMKQNNQNNLKPWDYQPIHNYYLIVVTELGLFCGLLWIFLIIKKIPNILKLQTLEQNNKTVTLILISTTIAMLFDHYYLTIPTISALLIILLSSSHKNVTHETLQHQAQNP